MQDFFFAEKSVWNITPQKIIKKVNQHMTWKKMKSRYCVKNNRRLLL